MPLRSSKMAPSTASIVLVQITSCARELLCGVLYCPYTGWRQPFVDVLEFTARLDALFDEIEFPLASTSYRAFTPKARRKRTTAAAPPSPFWETSMTAKPLNEKDKNTFVIHVQFRQGATWQGTVKWAGQNQERHFRSTLELLKIMDSAVAKSGLKEE